MTWSGDVPLTSAEAWRGIWMRHRSGPTRAAAKRGSTTVEISLWHRVAHAGERITVRCGRGPRGGYLWPGGGARLELARPLPGDTPSPGAVCPDCIDLPLELTGEETERLDVAGRARLAR